MAYGLVNMEISENEREREYVTPDLLAIQSSDSQGTRAVWDTSQLSMTFLLVSHLLLSHWCMQYHMRPPADEPSVNGQREILNCVAIQINLLTRQKQIHSY